MRNLIYAINLSLDGCCDHTKFYPGEGTMEYFTHLIQGVDTFVYGRITYQLMVPYWPDVAKNHTGDRKADIEFAEAFDAVEKIVVFSRTLDEGQGEKTIIIRSNLQDEILKLKQEEGKNILIGGVDLPSQLIGTGLVDEYRFVVHPLIAGEGRRLWESIGLPENLPLTLVESKVFKSGTVALRYLKS